MLAERFKATKAVGELKAAHAMPPADKIARSAADRIACASWPKPPISIRTSPRKFLAFIVTEVIRHHEKLQGKG
jgi:chorismate mutase